MMTARQNPDQSPEPVRLWATGRRVPLDPSGSRELIPTDIWSNLHLDIEGEGAAGKGLEYCDLRIYDADPAQAVSEDAQDAVAIVDAMKVCGDQLQQAAELPESTDPAPPIAAVLGRPKHDKPLKERSVEWWHEIRDEIRKHPHQTKRDVAKEIAEREGVSPAYIYREASRARTGR
jgi:hypothetical protein